jgi:hypothetical protein
MPKWDIGGQYSIHILYTVSIFLLLIIIIIVVVVVVVVMFSCHRFSFFPGTSPLEPVVNPTTQASRLSL